MNKQEQIKFIEDNYPAYTNHVSKRRIRHDLFKDITLILLEDILMGMGVLQGG